MTSPIISDSLYLLSSKLSEQAMETTYDKILRLFSSLSKEEKEDLKKLLRDRTTFSLDDLIEVKENKGIICPNCSKAEHIVRNGKRNQVQRYLCRNCGTSFTGLSVSFLSRTHKDFSTWKKYVRCLIDGFSLRKTAERCSISVRTAFFWRHKLLDLLRMRMNRVKLSGIVEADDTFLRVSFKGNKPVGREPYKRGTPASKPGLSREQIAISCVIDRNGKVYSKVSSRGRPTSIALKRAIGKMISPNSVLCTDNDTAYRRFARTKGLELIQLDNHETKGIYHIQHVNGYHSRLKAFIRKFKGVSCKYIENYLAWLNMVNERGLTLLQVLKAAVKEDYDSSWLNIKDRPLMPV